MRKCLIVPAMFAGVLASSAAVAQQASQQPQRVLESPTMVASPYGAYEFLIGDWYSKPTGGQDNAIHQRFSWGPNKSYIRYTTLTTEKGKAEAVHFDGIAVWNAKSDSLDYVFAIEPGSGAQEKGTIRTEADGTIVRDVLLTRADGKTGTFRQRFWKTGPDSTATSLMRQTAKGWEPNFPGSEAIVMSRQPL